MFLVRHSGFYLFWPENWTLCMLSYHRYFLQIGKVNLLCKTHIRHCNWSLSLKLLPTSFFAGSENFFKDNSQSLPLRRQAVTMSKTPRYNTFVDFSHQVTPHSNINRWTSSMQVLFKARVVCSLSRQLNLNSACCMQTCFTRCRVAHQQTTLWNKVLSGQVAFRTAVATFFSRKKMIKHVRQKIKVFMFSPTAHILSFKFQLF